MVYRPQDTRTQKRKRARGTRAEEIPEVTSTVSTWKVSIMFSGPQDTRAPKIRQAKGTRVWNGEEEHGKFQLWSPGPRIRERTCTNLQPTPGCFVSNHNLLQTGTLLQQLFQSNFHLYNVLAICCSQLAMWCGFQCGNGLSFIFTQTLSGVWKSEWRPNSRAGVECNGRSVKHSSAPYAYLCPHTFPCPSLFPYPFPYIPMPNLFR